ncbi:hypothetical protein FRC05_007638 [Tulasnella sp. 425]|nr:hypothetical protein FRC05_007638 [Tulasnella sp. 425]
MSALHERFVTRRALNNQYNRPVNVPPLAGSKVNLAAEEEIENSFGYDVNNLNLDRFTEISIRFELAALTSRPPPGLEDWALSPDNNVFWKMIPQEWMN